jgi:hypothetical protein
MSYKIKQSISKVSKNFYFVTEHTDDAYIVRSMSASDALTPKRVRAIARFFPHTTIHYVHNQNNKHPDMLRFVKNATV